jgi:hypothetical protein
MLAPLAAGFFAGAFLCNAIPHLASGLQGQPFPTPFATPRGVGESSPLLNFLWGFFNLAAGVSLLSIYPIVVGVNAPCLSLAAGALLLGLRLAIHFGRVRTPSGRASASR